MLGLWLVNVAVAYWVTHGDLDQVWRSESRFSIVFCELALGSTLFLVTAPFALTFVSLARACGTQLWFAGLQASVWACVCLFLYVDSEIYSRFRYHFNAAVWELLTTPGGLASVELESGDVARPAAIAVTWGLLQFLAVTCSTRARASSSRSPFRLGWAAACIGLLVVLADKLIYAHADLVHDRRTTSLVAALPFYLPVTVRELVTEEIGIRVEASATEAIVSMHRALDLPSGSLELGARASRPNVLMIVVESLRADVLDTEHMPRVSEFATTARSFVDHLSGGNATPYAMCSLLYGLPGPYWDVIVEEHRPPLLVDTLRSLGYECRVWASQPLTYPALRSTAWVGIEDRVEDDLDGEYVWQRERSMVGRFDEWLDSRTRAEPFFGFLMLNATHWKYEFDPASAPFHPYAHKLADIDVTEANTQLQARERIRRRYFNAVRFVDDICGELLAALSRHGCADDTVVLITGDHGEEFWEHGSLGHTSNFTRYQIHVPFLLRGPGIPSGVETRPTSHVDWVPTLMEVLGADPVQRASYTTGENLLNPPAHRARISAAWGKIALLLDDGAIVLTLEGAGAGLDAYGLDWEQHPDGEAYLDRHAGEITGLTRDCNRFLQRSSDD